MKKVFLLLLFIPTFVYCQPRALIMPEDCKIFDDYISYISEWRDQSKEVILEKTALFFLDTPYVAHTLEKGNTETMVINLRELDCFTFVENVIALTNTVVSGESDIDSFVKILERIRYRDGILKGFTSRLHYTSDWIFDNQQKGIMKNISLEIGGEIENKSINFMSSNRSSYDQLKDDDKALKEIVSVENEINKRGGFAYLPKENIGITAPLIPNLSVIAFTTKIKGLDTTHVGFAYKNGDKLTFIHASSLAMKVVVDSKSLDEYCQSQKNCTGIIVAKIL